MGGVEGHYSNGEWHWETYGLFSIPGAIANAVKESKRKSRYIEEQRRENELIIQREREKRENRRRQLEEMNTKIDTKIINMKNEFSQTFTIKKVIIPKNIENNILKACDAYYNTQKIKDEINELYKSLVSKKRIKNKFTVFIVGNTGNGKSTLVNACFKQYLSPESSVTPCHDFKIPKAFSHENLPDFEIYDTNGIEISGDNNIDNRLEEISDFIQGKGSDQNNMIDCIWYCITGNKFQDKEIIFLRKLNEIYFKKFPIILVYTQTKSLETAKEMENYSLKFFPQNYFIPVLAKDINLIGNLKIDKFGIDELINKTRELIINKEAELKKINAIKETEKIMKEKYLDYNYYSHGYSVIIRNHFNIENKQDSEKCLKEMKKYGKEVKNKIKKENIDKLFINIDKEIHKIMVEYKSIDKKDLSEIKSKFEKEVILKADDSIKIDIKIKKLIIKNIKEIITNTINREMELLN